MKYQDIIKEICDEENITWHLISEDYCFVLEKNNITKYLFGYSFSLNNQSLSNIIDDKYALYDLCKLKNIPIVEHQILFRKNINTYNMALEKFNVYNRNVVIKPNNGTEGNGVYHIQNENDLKITLDELFKNHYSVSICPYYHIDNEYRVVVLDGKVKLIFEKIRPTVKGDGYKTIKELLLELNPWYFTNINLDDYNKVLKKDELFVYDWRFNLSKGATAVKINDENLTNKLSKLALDITNTLGTRFVSVDIINSNGNLLLLEINSKVCINKVCNFIDKDYKIVKSIYKDAILKMFGSNEKVNDNLIRKSKL